MQDRPKLHAHPAPPGYIAGGLSNTAHAAGLAAALCRRPGRTCASREHRARARDRRRHTQPTVHTARVGALQGGAPRAGR